MLCFNNFTAKHMSTEPTGRQDVEELSKADISHESSLLPIIDAGPATKSQMPLGICCFVFDYKNISFFNLRNHLRFYYVENEINDICRYYLHLSDLDAATEVSALEEIDDVEALSIPVPSAIPPASTSLRDYVDQSETLSKLVQLGNKLLNLKIVNIKNILNHSYSSCGRVFRFIMV